MADLALRGYRIADPSNDGKQRVTDTSEVLYKRADSSMDLHHIDKSLSSPHLRDTS
jgi:hypothetical protein